MVRPLTFSFLLLAAACVAAADETAMNPSAASAPATNTPVVNASPMGQSPEATKHGAKMYRTKERRADKDASDTKAAGDETANPAATASAAVPPGGDVKMSGMSILGNEDAPKSLVLVPWKSSQLGDMPSVSRLLDSATRPVDKDVFMRELAYYEYKSSSK